MNLEDKLQAAEVAIAAVGLLVTLIGTCIAWHAVKGKPICFPKRMLCTMLCHALLTD